MSAARPLTLQPADRERLRGGAAALGLVLDEAALDRFSAYAALLAHWRESANLISYRDGAELVERHLLDSLACGWLCAAARTVVDLGTGAGLPGIPLAIIDPARRVVLVEPRRRRASFLRQVRRDLRLDAAEIHETRAEDVGTIGCAPVDIAVLRAVWRDDANLHLVVPWLRHGGVLLSMRAESHPAPAAIEGLCAEPSMTYQIGGHPRRRVDVFRVPFPG